MSDNETAVTPFGKGPVSLRNSQQLAEGLKAAAAKDPRGGAPDGSTYLNFSGKRGVYEFGPDKEDIDSDEVWLVNVASFEEGWKCWKGGQPRASRMSSVYAEAVPDPDFEEHGPFDANRGEGWFQAKALVLKSVDEDNRQAYFANNSKSGVSSIARLQDDIAERLMAGLPYWPLVQLGREKFKAQGYDNSKPVFNTYGWLDDAAVQELAANPDADADDLIAASEKRASGNGKAVEKAPDDAPTGATKEEPKQADAPASRKRKAGSKRPSL